MLERMPPIAYPLLLAIFGAAVYLFALPGPRDARVSRLGEIMFFCGMFWFAYLIGTAAVHALLHTG
jgi:hypothetical protein